MDLSVLESALTQQLALGLGASSYTPFALFSTSTTPSVSAMVFRGWPLAAHIQSIQAGNCLVFVMSDPGMTRSTDVFAQGWNTISTVPITVSVTTTAHSVTFAGSPTSGQVVGVSAGEIGWTHRCTNTDTPNSIAAALQGVIAGSTVSGATLTLPTTKRVFAGVVSDYTQMQELRRQAQCFKLYVWAPSPAARDAVGAAVNVTMNAMRSVIVGSEATDIPKYRGVWVRDSAEKEGVYGREERWEINYATTRYQTVNGILFLGAQVNQVISTGVFQPGTSGIPTPLGT